jgi:hypothetical protein
MPQFVEPLSSYRVADGPYLKPAGTHVATLRVHAVSRNYRVMASGDGLHFYRNFDDEPGSWFHEGDAPGVTPADWKRALQKQVFG